MRIALVLFTGLIVASCAMPGVTGCDTEAKALAAADPGGMTAHFCRALEGGDSLQYELAQMLEAEAEKGKEPAANMKKAVHWYKLAARSSSGATPVYMAPVGNQKYGWVMNVQTGLATRGDARAQFRLSELYMEGRYVKQSDKKARVWLGRAATQGYPPAVNMLLEMEAELAGKKSKREMREIGG